MSSVSKCLQIKWADSNLLDLTDDDRQQNMRKKRKTSDGQTDSEKLLESFLHFHALKTKWLSDQGARESYYACESSRVINGAVPNRLMKPPTI